MFIADGHHPCQAPKPIDPRTLDAVLFPPINQWGQMPYPIEPLSPHSASRLARQADTGLAHHKAVHVDESVAVCNAVGSQIVCRTVCHIICRVAVQQPCDWEPPDVHRRVRGRASGSSKRRESRHLA